VGGVDGRYFIYGKLMLSTIYSKNVHVFIQSWNTELNSETSTAAVNVVI